jgi:uncharacterized metal-binding protein YceD (DUF177 family)
MEPTGAEFARPVAIDALAPDVVVDIAATPDECALLARRLGLLALARLEARVRLKPLGGGLLRLEMELAADVVQACVVTLEPVASRVSDRATLLYAEAARETTKVVLDGEAELIEPLDGDVLDIGEAVAQQLSLALDPYPRAGDAGMTVPSAGDDGEKHSPFAALAGWKKKR